MTTHLLFLSVNSCIGNSLKRLLWTVKDKCSSSAKCSGCCMAVDLGREKERVGSEFEEKSSITARYLDTSENDSSNSCKK